MDVQVTPFGHLPRDAEQSSVLYERFVGQEMVAHEPRMQLTTVSLSASRRVKDVDLVLMPQPLDDFVGPLFLFRRVLATLMFEPHFFFVRFDTAMLFPVLVQCFVGCPGHDFGSIRHLRSVEMSLSVLSHSVRWCANWTWVVWCGVVCCVDARAGYLSIANLGLELDEKKNLNALKKKKKRGAEGDFPWVVMKRTEPVYITRAEMERV
jgi:hypothetical protein